MSATTNGAVQRRDAIDVARVLALAIVVWGHLAMAVIDRSDGKVRGANLLALHPGWVAVAVAAPMPVFFAAGGWANATSTLAASAARLRTLAGLAATVVATWSAAVVTTVLLTGDSGIIGDGARLATQPLWFVAAYAPFSAAGRPLARFAATSPVMVISGCLAALVVLDLARFAWGAPEWIGWIGFLLAWVVPWLVGGWWRDRSQSGSINERRTGAILLAVSAATAVVLVQAFGYSAALIDVVPGARSNTSPPTLYTAVAGLAQVGVLLLVAPLLDSLGRRRRQLWNRAGEAAVAIYAWHLTALALCAALIAAGLPVPRRDTVGWWVTRPVWWALVITVASAFVGLTQLARARLGPRVRPAAPVARTVAGVLALAAAGAAVGLEGPRTLPYATAWSALFVVSWWLLGGRGRKRAEGA